MAAPGIARETFREFRKDLPPQLPDYLRIQRWFGGKARAIRGAEIIDVIPIESPLAEAFVLLARVNYEDGPAETYVMPLLFSYDLISGDMAAGPALKLHSRRHGGEAALRNGLAGDKVASALLDSIAQGKTFAGLRGEIRCARTDVFHEICPRSPETLAAKPVKAEQSNSSIVYGRSFILKFFRRAQQGINPELEMGQFLTEKAHFANIASVAGSIEYHGNDGALFTMGILQGFVPNQGDAWEHTLGAVSQFYQCVAKRQRAENSPVLASVQSLPSGVFNHADVPPPLGRMIGSYLNDARLLGQRTAEMHRALACDSSDPAFAPEPYTVFAQHAAEQRARRLAESTIALLRDRSKQLQDRARELARQVECGEREMLRQFHSALTGPEQLCRIRIHGDYHLGQVLYTGSDFVIIDFEGEPARPIEERRIKLSPLQDVAGMLRSFHYAAHAALRAFHKARPEEVHDGAALADWAEIWSTWVGHEFLLQYLEISRGACYLPTNWDELDKLLRMHLLEKAVYELNYELNNRPDWVEIPLVGITKLLAS